MIKRYASIFDAMRLIRAVFAVGFTSSNTEKFRPAIIEMARNVFFPNIQNIIGGLKYMVSVIDNMKMYRCHSRNDADTKKQILEIRN